MGSAYKGEEGNLEVRQKRVDDVKGQPNARMVTTQAGKHARDQNANSISRPSAEMSLIQILGQWDTAHQRSRVRYPLRRSVLFKMLLGKQNGADQVVQCGATSRPMHACMRVNVCGSRGGTVGTS